MPNVVRKATLAGRWYPGSASACRDAIAGYREGRKAREDVTGKAVAALGPHAGWSYSGPTLALTIDALARHAESPDTVILFGAVHAADWDVATLGNETAWATPLGEVPVDVELAAALLELGADTFASHPQAHAREHSIEVMLPFIFDAFPKSRILPVAMPPVATAVAAGSCAARAARSLGRKTVAIASSDLTHYGMVPFGWAPAGSGEKALRWAREENDRPFLDALTRMDAEGALREGLTRRSACGPGAAAAAVAFAREEGASRGVWVDYSTSADAESASDVDHFVTYAGVVWMCG